MFGVELTIIDHVSGTRKTQQSKRRYKTEQGAQKAAESSEFICKPDGLNPTTEVVARVVTV